MMHAIWKVLHLDLLLEGPLFPEMVGRGKQHEWTRLMILYELLFLLRYFQLRYPLAQEQICRHQSGPLLSLRGGLIISETKKKIRVKMKLTRQSSTREAEHLVSSSI